MNSPISDLNRDFFHVGLEEMQAGDVKIAGQYGNGLKNDGSYSKEDDEFLEYYRENIRVQAFTEKPSRFKSTFVFITIEDAKNYRNMCKIGGIIYRVKFKEKSSKFHCACAYINYSKDNDFRKIEANKFWSNPDIYAEGTEVFSESDLIILERLEV